MSESEQGCLFCRIHAGAAHAQKVFEDERTFAMLDLRQPRAGHCLVIPRQHAETLCELSDADGAAVMRTARRLVVAVRAAFRPDGLSVWQSNGAAAGQEVPHVHLHVLPRWAGDELLRISPRPIKPLAPGELASQAEAIRRALIDG